MNLILLNLYPPITMARYLISSYVLKAYLVKYYDSIELKIDILNYSNTFDERKIVNRIIKLNPKYIGYSCYIWNIEKVLKVIAAVKKESNAKHILGGPEITIKRINSFKDPRIGDFYVIGEGEHKLLNLLNYLENRGNLLIAPKGVAYWDNDKLIYKEDYENIRNLDKIPSIYLNDIIEDRLYAKQQAFLETQRGCILRCKYCVYSKFLPSINYYSLKRIFNELHHLVVEKKITALRFFDAIFTSDLDRAKEIVKFLIDLKKNENIELPWIYWEYNFNLIDDEFLKLISHLKKKDNILNSNELQPQDRAQHYSDMVKDYIALNCVGLQSFSNKTLKAVGRPGIDLNRFDDFMNKFKELNLVLKVDLILGLPFETFNSYFDGIELFLGYLKNTDHILNIHRLQILPGSELEDLIEEYNIKYSKDSPHQVFSTNTITDQEMILASKLTAILFRIINSPLRKYLIEMKEQIGDSYFNIIKAIFDEIDSSVEFKDIYLKKNEYIDDLYWNDDVFKEIPSRWFLNYFKKYIKKES